MLVNRLKNPIIKLYPVQCEGVYQAACEYPWYDLEPKQAKNLILLMNRANKPLYVTVGKIFPLTMNAFCSVSKHLII